RRGVPSGGGERGLPGRAPPRVRRAGGAHAREGDRGEGVPGTGRGQGRGAAGGRGHEDGERHPRTAGRPGQVRLRGGRPDGEPGRRARGAGMTRPSRVTVVEVGPRDGLQNEAAAVTVDDRVAFSQALLDAGLRVVEVGAFVSPKWVPQMAGSEEVHRRLRRPPGARMPVLVPNRKGYEAARAAGVREIAVFTAASETFNRKNTNAGIDESFARFAEFVPEARGEGLWVRGYVSTCFG